VSAARTVQIVSYLTLTTLLITQGSLFISAQGQATNSTTDSYNSNANSTADNLSKNPPFIGSSSFYVVSSSNMMPTLRKGDIVGIENQTSFDNLKVGDIIQ
jgi:hypothetical protein